MNIYPIAGITYQNWRNDTDNDEFSSYKKLGLNIGAGLEYMATSTLKISIEGNYSWIKHYDSSNFFVGIGYLF